MVSMPVSKEVSDCMLFRHLVSIWSSVSRGQFFYAAFGFCDVCNMSENRKEKLE